MVPSSTISSFISKIEMGVQWFNDAGSMLVRMKEKDPDIFDEILKQSNVSWLTMDVLSVFELIGLKKLAVEAMFLPRHVVNRLLLLPLEQQFDIATKAIAVVVGTREGRHDVIEKSAGKLTKVEAAAVIGPDGIRTPKEQVTYMVVKPKEDSIGKYTLFMADGKLCVKKSIALGDHQKVWLSKAWFAHVELFRSAS